jgi:vancomycin resistance protein YoaR
MSQVLNFKTFKLGRLWLPVLLVVVTGGLLVAMIFGVLGYQVIYLNRVYPGVVVADIKAGGMTKAELTNAVTARAGEYLLRPITIQANGESWTFTGQELGIRTDVSTTVVQAFAVGREGSLWADVLTQLKLLGTPQHIDPVLVYDTGPSNQVLQRLTEQIDYPPQNAELIINPDGTIETVPSQRGRQLHVDGTRVLLEEALFSKKPQPVQAITQEILPPIPNVEQARQQAENLLSGPIKFQLQTDTDNIEWHMAPDVVAELLVVTEVVDDAGQTQVVLELDPEEFTPYVEQFAPTINRKPVDAQLEFDDEAGELVVVQESSRGRTLDVVSIYEQLAVISESPESVVKLTVKDVLPVVNSENVEALGIKELVSESTSYFKGSSEGRMKNIALAASKFNGVIIPPGEEFSFNEHLGEVTKENGFDESLIIYGDRTTVGIGGGVCQVSTTAFRTAFLGGFKIIERWAHGYRVGWYETNSVVGLDATIYTPDVDLRFRNDTGHFLLIQTEADLVDGTVTFKFYGSKPDREVIVSEPTITNLVKHGPPLYEDDPTLPKGVIKQVDWPKDGMDVAITRTVKISDTVLYEDVLVSKYRPWRAVYKRGTGEQVSRNPRTN